MTTSIQHARTEERALDNDLGAERMLIGFMLTKPALIDEFSVRLKAEDFYNPRHGEVFAALISARAAGQPIEPVAFAGYLADMGSLGRLGGGLFLNECANLVTSSAGSPGWYVERVIEKAARREYQADGVRLAQAATAPGMSAEDLATLAESLANKARPRREDLELVQLGSLINPCLDDIEAREKRPGGIKTGFLDLDRLLGGLRPKQLVTVAGATSMGKSVALVDFARHIAIKLGLTVALFSLEMSKEDIFDRIIAAEAGVPLHLIRDGLLDARDWQKISARIGPLSNAPLFVADKAPLTVGRIVGYCKGLRQRHGLDVAMVDHMHLVTPSQKFNDEKAMIDDVSRGLKLDLAMTLEIPVVAAAQLNRNPSARSDKRPQLQDLKNSSSIEQHSDVVILLHRDDYYDKDSPRRGEADFIVDKNRNGAKDVVTVAAQLDKSRFVDMAIPA